jgi:YbbR domain-containing protein
MMFARIKNAWTRFRSRQIVLELLVSVCLACLVWLYLHNRARNSIDHVAVPVEVQLATHQRDHFVLEISESRTVLVSFTGPHSRIREIRRKLQRGMLKANLTLTVPEGKRTEAMFSEMLHVDEDAIAVPIGVNVEIAQENIPITVHRLTDRTLPVKLECTGNARVSEIKIEPASVLVRGPKAVLDRASFLPTQPYGVEVSAQMQATADTNVRDQIALVTELDGRPIQTNPASVQFRLKAAPKQKIYDLVDVPIHFLFPKDSPWKARFGNHKESKVTLKLVGPATDETPPVLAFVDLTRGNLARGRNLEPLRLQLPKDFQLAQPATALVTFYLDELERTTATSRKNE